MLRMILDCSEEESLRIEEYLRQGRKRGDLFVRNPLFIGLVDDVLRQWVGGRSAHPFY